MNKEKASVVTLITIKTYLKERNSTKGKKKILIMVKEKL